MVLFLVFLSSLFLAFGETPPATAAAPSPELVHAQQVLAELNRQVEAGIAPRQKLQEAEEALKNAQDADLVNRMLTNTDLTEDQAAELRSAAQRRLERSKSAMEKKQRLVEAGIETAQSIGEFAREKEWAQTQLDMALARVDSVHRIAEIVREEQQMQEQLALEAASRAAQEGSEVELPRMEHFVGNGVFRQQEFELVQTAFAKEFHRPLPVSADGETAVHRAMGFDHRNRVDVAVLPDTVEGVWLRHYLEKAEIPYYAFRGALARKATGAHIHIGPASTKL